MAGYLIGSRRLKRMELRFLQSGHSHEDVDAWFSVLSNLLESKKHLETPEDFQQVLQEFLVDPKQRPHEQKFRGENCELYSQLDFRLQENHAGGTESIQFFP